MTSLNSKFNFNLLDTFVQNNPNYSAAAFDPDNLHHYKWSKTGKDQLISVLKALKSFALAGVGSVVSRKLLEQNIHSPVQITRLSRWEYDQLVKDTTGSESDVLAYDRALGIKNRLLLHVLDTMQQGEPYVNAGLFHNASEKVHKDATALMEIFQRENGCACSECTSVFSPAAYYEDLKKFIKKYLDTTGLKPDSPLWLKERRPDLDNLQLTCDATFESKLHLEIINDVLASIVDKSDPWDKLAKGNYPFNLPANLYLRKNQAILSHFKTGMADLYRVFATAPDKTIVTRELLQLSVSENELLVKSNILEAHLRMQYGFREPAPNWRETLSSVPEFLNRAGLTRKQLDELLFQNLHHEERESGVSQAFFINSPGAKPGFLTIKKDDTLEVKEIKLEKDSKATALTPTILPSLEHFDHLHRFIRLAQRIGWSFAELDLVLRTACGNHLKPETLPIIGAVRFLQIAWGVPLAELQCLWSPIDNLGFGAGPEFALADPFNSLFNNSLAAQANSYILPVNSERKKALYKKLFGEKIRPLESNDPLVNTRLLGAFHINQKELDLLLKQIFPGGPPYKEILDLPYLSLIQRYVQLSRWLKLPVADLLLLFELISNDAHLSAYNPFDIYVPFSTSASNNPHIILRSTKPEDILWLAQLLSQINAWLKENKITVEQLAALCDGDKQKQTLTPEQLRELFQNLARKFRQALLQATHLESADTTASQALLDFNELSKDGRHIDKDHLGVISMNVLKPIHQGILTQFSDRQKEVVYKTLATSLGVTELQISCLVKEAHIRTGTTQEIIPFIMIPILKAKEDITPDIGGPEFKKFFTVIQALAETTKRFDLTAEDLKVLTKRREDFQLDPNNPLGKLSLSNMRTLYDLRKVEIPAARKHIRDLVKESLQADFTRRLGKDVKEKLWKPLWDTPGNNEKAQKSVSQLLIGLLKAKAGEQGWAILEKNLDAALHTWKRDRLGPFVIHSLQGKPELKHIRSARDLYEYLLLDTEMGPDTSTTPMLNGISTLQLYINRCRLHLEEGVTLREPEKLESIWAWMDHYRTWEANRKVFVYPENYIQPNLRPDQTPLFKTLSQAIMQSDASDENVESAFNGYLDDLAAVANLNICGSYVYNDPSPGSIDKILVLLGRKITNPVKTYFRTARFIGITQGVVWEPWEEIQVHMDSELLYPVYAFGKLFVFWVEVKEYMQKDKEKPDSKEYKAQIFYTFHNANGHWHQPQNLAELELDKLPEEHRPRPDLWNRIVISYRTSVRRLIIFYGRSKTLQGLSSFPITFQLDENMDVLQADPKKNSITSELPTLWHTSAPPKVGNALVITTIPNDPDFIPISNQPDWFVFRNLKGSFLLRPLNAFPAVDITPAFPSGHPLEKQDQVAIAETLSRVTMDDGIINMVPNEGFRFGFYLYLTSTALQNKNLITLTSVTGTVFRFYINNRNISLDLFNRVNSPNHPNGFNYAIKDNDLNNWLHIQCYAGERENPGTRIFGSLAINKTIFPALDLSWPANFNQRMAIQIENTAGIFLTGLSLTDKYDGTGKRVGWWPMENDFNDYSGKKQHFDDKPNKFLLFHRHINHTSRYSQNPGFDIHRLTSNAVPTLIHKLHTGGVNALLKTETQRTPELPAFGKGVNEINYNPSLIRRIPSSKHLGFDDADGIYYRELFFHAPWLLADHLRNDQRFSEAQRWYQQVFNPTIKESINPPEYRWRYLPFQPERTAGAMSDVSFIEEKDTPFSGKPDTLAFNGNSSFINAGNEIELNNKSFTIEFWAKAKTTTNERRYILNLGTREENKGLGIFFETTGPVYFSFFGNDVLTDLAHHQDNLWHHWAFVHDMAGENSKKSEKKIYKNGAQILTKEYGTQGPFLGSGTLFIGKENWGGKAFAGQLSELRIWETARSAADIKNSWNRRLNTNELNDSHLLRYWPLDKVAGNLVPNLAGSGSGIIGNESGKLRMLAADPFNPHYLGAIREITYKKAFTSHYIQNLLDQGDALFRVYTSESIVKATMYYVMAAQLLGKRPAPKSGCTIPSNTSTVEEASPLQSSILLALEQRIDLRELPEGTTDHPALSILDGKFCIPENEHFISYWDRVEDRLHKIRHGLNIDGIKEPLPLFDMPLDAETWLQGAIGGSSTGIATLTMDVPHYRFTTILAKAKEFTAQVSQLGNALLSALEKKDAEMLGLLHNTHERNILDLTARLKEDQLEEARENTLSLSESISSAKLREAHYAGLHNEYMSPLENAQLATMITAHVFSAVAGTIKLGAVAAHMFPQVEIPGNWGTNVSFGGFNLGAAIDAAAAQYDMVAGQFSFASNLTATLGSYQRRDQEWTLQQKLAAGDIKQLDHQAKAAQSRLRMAQRDIEIHKKNRAQNEEIQSYMLDKFTNQELYQWMVAKIAGLYFNAYQMAYDLALSAEKAWQFELMAKDKFINGIYWDSLKKGLLSGEALQLDLNRMEKTWMEKNKRRFEIDRTISLMQINPGAVMKLKAEGNCDFSLSEELFSNDFPGHYGRQVKSISLSFPAVVGPYQNFNATLKQTSNHILVTADPKGLKYLLNTALNPEPSVRSNWRKNEQVALSRGLNDSGVFELNFHDDRYLPFEGTGAVSGWNLALNNNNNGINSMSITDVIIHIQYTALQGADAFREMVKAELKLRPQTEGFLLNMKRDFQAQWEELLNAKETNINVSEDRFRKLDEIKLDGFYILLDLTEEGKKAIQNGTLKISIEKESRDIKLTNGVAWMELKPGWSVFKGKDWKLKATAGEWKAVNVRNMLILAVYSGKTPTVSNAQNN